MKRENKILMQKEREFEVLTKMHMQMQVHIEMKSEKYIRK